MEEAVYTVLETKRQAKYLADFGWLYLDDGSKVQPFPTLMAFNEAARKQDIAMDKEYYSRNK